MARAEPSLKLTPTPAFVGPGTYDPHIPDPKDKRPGLEYGINRSSTFGATSAFLTPKPTYYNILFSHPLFGHLSPWATNKAQLLPPINSVAGANVAASERLQARVYGHDEVGIAAGESTTALPQWGALGPGAKAAHPGASMKSRTSPRKFVHPSSPSAHCPPSQPLPEIPKIRERTVSTRASSTSAAQSCARGARARWHALDHVPLAQTAVWSLTDHHHLLPCAIPCPSVQSMQTRVPDNNHPLHRLPAHTLHRKQIEQVLYRSKRDPQAAAAIAIQSRVRGQATRRAMQ